jgi:hypothetical protein
MRTTQVIKSLREAELSQKQAEAIAGALEDQGLDEIKRDLLLLKWMVGVNSAMTIAILWKVFSG